MAGRKGRGKREAGMGGGKGGNGARERGNQDDKDGVQLRIYKEYANADAEEDGDGDKQNLVL